MSIRIFKKNQLRLSFSGSLLFFKKNGASVQNKKAKPESQFRKRILVGVLIISLMSSIFDVETKYDSFGLHFSVPLLFETAQHHQLKEPTI